VLESSLLQHIYAFNRSISPSVLIPPGDDMAMLKLDGTRLLAAVDQIVEGRHFLPGTPLELVGRKAVTRNLSDVAAMAARPVAALAAGVLPREFTQAQANTLFDAMRSTADSYGCPLIGGDISIHAAPNLPLICSVTILAEPLDENHPPIRRAGAQPGDHLYVTGALGGSFGADGRGRHLTFEPRVSEAAALLRTLGDRLHAMIDVSDGLGRDAAHLARDSNLTLELIAEVIPRNPGIALINALSDGEDYELLFAASGEVPAKILSTPITRIGAFRKTATADPLAGAVWCEINGARTDVSTKGWDHAAIAPAD
jgi:thiamine-monophosphate kinase